MRTRWWRPSEPTRRRAFAVVLPLVVTCGCPSRQLRTIDPPTAESKGPGMAVDPIAEIPRPSDVAAPREAVVTLRAPVATEVVAELVHHVFEAFHTRSVTPIDGDLDDTVIDIRFDGTESSLSRYAWTFNFRMRLRSSPFDQLDIDQMYRAQDVELYAREDLGLPGRPLPPASMLADDLLVRIPIATTRIGADPLFGDEIRLLLRRDGGRYRLRGYGEILPH